MDNTTYHSDTSRISKSGLDVIDRSPAHYYAKYLDPNRIILPPKPHLIVGSITHSAILEADKLEKEYFILNDKKIVAEIGGGNPRLTTRYKEWKKLALEEQGNRQEVSETDFDHVRRMRDSVHSHPAASFLLEDGQAEFYAEWTDSDTNAPCKMKADWLSSTGFITDLKTTEDAREDPFGRSAWKWRYPVQGAFYNDGMVSNYPDSPPEGFCFIAVEKEPPYAVAVYYLDEEGFQVGREAYKRNLEVYMSCRMQGVWPAYPLDIRPLKLPMFKKM